MSLASQRSRRVGAGLALAALLTACAGGGAASDAQPGADADLDVVLASVSEREQPRTADARDVEAVGKATEGFALDLYRRIAKAQDGNVIVGPYSAWLALAMTSVGASGETAQELAKALRFPLTDGRLLPAINALDRGLAHRASDDAVRFDVANRLWGQRGTEFLAPFLDALVQHFGAPLVEADFRADPEAATAEINRWVDGRTEGKIPTLFPAGALDESTRLALVNAVHLDAPWEFAFDPASTRSGTFTRADKSKVSADFMHYDQYLPSAYDPAWQAVELPYEGGGLSMVVIVPRNFTKFEAALDQASLDRILGKIKDDGIHLSLPRFTFSTHASLIEALQGMGVRTAFGPGADFSRMTAGGGLFVGAVEHEAFVQVDESGTEAAAATGVGMRGSHGPTITVDRPFLFLIRDKATGATLFVGRVLDPTA